MSPLFEAYDSTEHAARMVEGARAAHDDGRLEDALADLLVAQAANHRAIRRIESAIESVRSEIALRQSTPAAPVHGERK